MKDARLVDRLRHGDVDAQAELYERHYAAMVWIEATYFYLGRVYAEQGQKGKALEAFENCLSSGQGVRLPDQFPLKEARAAIAQIKGQ